MNDYASRLAEEWSGGSNQEISRAAARLLIEGAIREALRNAAEWIQEAEGDNAMEDFLQDVEFWGKP